MGSVSFWNQTMNCLNSFVYMPLISFLSIIMVMSIYFDDLDHDANETLLQVSDALFEVLEGDARNVLCEAVERHQAEMLVVGSHGYGAIKRYCHFLLLFFSTLFPTKNIFNLLKAAACSSSLKNKCFDKMNFCKKKRRNL